MNKTSPSAANHPMTRADLTRAKARAPIAHSDGPAKKKRPPREDRQALPVKQLSIINFATSYPAN